MGGRERGEERERGGRERWVRKGASETDKRTNRYIKRD